MLTRHGYRIKGSYALIIEKLAALISDSRVLRTALCDSQLSDAELIAECIRRLSKSPVSYDRLIKNYLEPFKDIN
jgi:hypothetical protein